MEKWDLVIVGGGPAGLSAALVASSNFIRALVLEKSPEIGGNIRLADAPILDVLGQPAANGDALIHQFKAQIDARSEIRSRCGVEVTSIEQSASGLKLILDDGAEILARSVILATGTRPRRLQIPGSQFINGHHQARSIVDHFEGEAVAVIGGGDEASDIAVCLAQAGAQVSMLVRSKLRARPRFAEPLLAQSNIEMIENVEAKSIESGPQGLTLRLSNERSLKVADIFVRIGVELAMPSIKPDLERHEDGRVKIDEHGRTSVPGLYAAGDLCRRPEQWYVAVAQADGVIAARSVEEDRTRTSG